MKFSHVSENNYLSSKLDSTHKNESRGMFSFQNRAQKQISRNCMQNGLKVLSSKNVFFKRSSFGNFETIIGFMASKKVFEWSQILILSPSWPYTQNETSFN